VTELTGRAISVIVVLMRIDSMLIFLLRVLVVIETKKKKRKIIKKGTLFIYKKIKGEN
jgi:hypothetical protein